MASDTVMVNRAPVMTLWAAVVAEKLGYQRDEALTMGKTVAGLNAQSKGQRLGIYEPSEEEPEKKRERQPGEAFSVSLLGREVQVVQEDDGIRALTKGKPVDPDSVERYLEKKFGDDLDRVRQAMMDLAGSYDKKELRRKAYELYEKFRPEIPEGKRGWGAEGPLDLDFIESLKGS